MLKEENGIMISVCMATYNGEKYVKEQLDSILKQLSENDEVIVSDDGSTDRTRKIIKSFNDKRIKLFANNSHCYTSNFENALKHAKGEYIFLSDQDDVWLDNKIDIMTNYLREYDFVISNAKIVDENLSVKIESRNEYLRIRKGFIRNLIKSYYLGCCMAFNRKVLNTVLPFPKNHDLARHDTWISLLSEYCFKTYVCDEPLILYRRHGDNASHGAIGHYTKIGRVIKIRLYILAEIIKRKNKCILGANIND